MKIETKKVYICEICGARYDKKEVAKKCESVAISQDKGVKIGDIVRITKDKGFGARGKVTKIFVYSMTWGHYDWQRYWHTVGLEVDVIDSWGSRLLTFDSYELISKGVVAKE